MGTDKSWGDIDALSSMESSLPFESAESPMLRFFLSLQCREERGWPSVKDPNTLSEVCHGGLSAAAVPGSDDGLDVDTF
jgi:hypothetical protein